MNQNTALLKYLRNHSHVTAWTAAEKLGILRLSERIRELEAAGVKIERKWSPRIAGRYGNPVRVRMYSLP